MPELPEVETTMRGIAPHILQQKITSVVIRHFYLRWPIPKNLASILEKQIVLDVTRRGKYLLLATAKGTLIIHLGMSGCLRVMAAPIFTSNKHDHVDICFANKICLRLTDPRRFGALLWTDQAVSLHPLIKNLGIEPLAKEFTGKYLFERAQGRKVAIKTFIMDSKVIVGVGNIYAAESLFASGIHPLAATGNLNLAQCKKLVTAIKKILLMAIAQGGTTLKDFFNSSGKPGYFKAKLKVYGRGGLPCVKCASLLSELRLASRHTVYCSACQPLKRDL
jgi:formamidopyrimidine-DNA glycosylase